MANNSTGMNATGGNTMDSFNTEADAAVSDSHMKELQRKYPRIPAGDIRVPPARQLTTPDFDVGGHCLAEERAGRGSFDQCLEVVGRELIAQGGAR